jgi:hypothetical protein
MTEVAFLFWQHWDLTSGPHSRQALYSLSHSTSTQVVFLVTWRDTTVSSLKWQKHFVGRLPGLEVKMVLFLGGFVALGFTFRETWMLSQHLAHASPLVFCLVNPSPFPFPTQQLNILISASLFFPCCGAF